MGQQAPYEIPHHRILTPRQVEDAFGYPTEVALQEFRMPRSRGCGPRWIAIGRRIFYRAGDIRLWLDAHRSGISDRALADTIIEGLGETWGDGSLHGGLLEAERLFKRVLAPMAVALIQALAEPRPFGLKPARRDVLPDAEGMVSFVVTTPSGEDVAVRYELATGRTIVGDAAPWSRGPIELLCRVFGLRRGRVVTMPEVVEHLLALEGLRRLGIARPETGSEVAGA